MATRTTNLSSEEPVIERISIEFPVGNGFHLSDARRQRSSWRRDPPPLVVMDGSDRNGKS
jgi:hypothetical protein